MINNYIKADIKAIGLIFFISILIISAFLFVNYIYIRDFYIAQNESTADKVESLINSKLKLFEGDARFLTCQSESIYNNSKSDTLAIKQLLENFALAKPIYHQLRLLNTSGYEIIRYDHDTIQNIREFVEQLQDKSQRYYFKIGNQLDQTELAFSKIDLNIENQVLETPYRPMLRIISPIYHKDSQLALLVLNANVNYIFQIEKRYMNESEDFRLVNADGYYLIHPDIDKTFGYMKDKTEDNVLAELNIDGFEVIEPASFYSHAQSQYIVSTVNINNKNINQFTDNQLNQHLLNGKYYVIQKLSNHKILLKVLFNKTSLFFYGIIIIILFTVFTLRYFSFKKEILSKQLQQINTKLSTTNNTLRNLVNIASHDFRSPYSNIISIVDILLEKTTDIKDIYQNEIRYLSTRIRRIAFSSLQMLDNTLIWSKLQMNDVSQNPSSFLIEDMIHPIIAFNEQIFENKNLKYQFTIDKSIELKTDKESLSVILRNLISNASKFSFEKGIVFIDVYHLNSELIFQVEDQGVGMSEKQINTLMESSANFTQQGTFGEKGHGIGMNLVFEFARKMKGYITIESESGKGSIFKFHLPL